MKTVAFTRPADRIPESLALAESMGFRVMAAPSLNVTPGDPYDFRRIANLLEEGEFRYVVFGSATGVEMCAEYYGKETVRLFADMQVVAIGPYTEKALKKHGIRVDLVPEDYSSYGLVEMLEKKVNRKNVLLVRSDSGSEVLREGLEDAGAIVMEFAAYKLTEVGMTDALAKIMDGIAGGTVDAMAFTSPMSAESFFKLMKERHPDADAIMKKVRVAAIGKPTAMRLTEMGRKPDIVPAMTTFEDMLAAIKDSYKEEKK